MLDDTSFLEYCVYYPGALGNNFTPLPGFRTLEGRTAAILESRLPTDITWQDIVRKVEQSCRKLALMWIAGDLAAEAERDFYSSTIRDSPALFGEEAVRVQYHLEALVFFARSALDIASFVFGYLLIDALEPKRYDSFNELLKNISKANKSPVLVRAVDEWRNDPEGWLSVLAETTRGRSLRDKIAHQIGFPIHYCELDPRSEKESPVVALGTTEIPLQTFIDALRNGVIGAFLLLEEECVARVAGFDGRPC